MRFKSMTYDGKNVVYNESFWTGKKEIVIDNVLLPKGIKKNTFMYNEKECAVKGNILFGAKLINGFDEIVLVPKLTAVEWIFVILPLILVVIGGMVGALCGVISATMFVLLARTMKNNLFKILLGLATTGLAVVVWLFVSVIITLLTSA